MIMITIYIYYMIKKQSYILHNSIYILDNNTHRIYIYIVIHRQTVSFYQNSSVWLDTQDARSRDRNPSNFTLDCVSDHSSTQGTTLAKGILRYFYFWKQQQQPFVYIFYTLSATRVLNSFEELCITLAATGNSFARELNPHGGAYTMYK